MEKHNLINIIYQYHKDDLYETRFADGQTVELDEKISLVEQKKWISQQVQDDVLHDVTAFTVTKEKSIVDKSSIKKLEDINVKERVAKLWPQINKDYSEKGWCSYDGLVFIIDMF
jgi:hypothetical protein